ncbi:MAG: antibiotic biosynthesis monooxygenase family protein [Vulcanimicrobiaceae bacterium]
MFYRYRVHPAQARAFEHAFGPTGPWAQLFARHPGFRRTRLFRRQEEDATYLTVDVWHSKADWDAFRSTFAGEVIRLEKQLRWLVLEELLLGIYEGPQEYET